MVSNESDIDEIFTEWEDRINFLTDHISELESQILYYQNLVAEKDMRINQLKAENASLKGQRQTQVVQQPSNYTPPPRVLHPPPTSNSAPNRTIQAEKPIESPRGVKVAMTIAQNTISDENSLRKRQCPQCGAFGFAIKEMDDKTHVLCYKPIKIYAKKRVCTKCRHEF